jgi:hypothetical protein
MNQYLKMKLNILEKEMLFLNENNKVIFDKIM